MAIIHRKKMLKMAIILREDLAKSGYRPDMKVQIFQSTFYIFMPTNWKPAIENGLEGVIKHIIYTSIPVYFFVFFQFFWFVKFVDFFSIFLSILFSNLH